MEIPAVASAPTASAPVSLPTEAPVPATTFEIGLVMAGAVSAGAYTAGVINFLFEALDNWHNPAVLRAKLGWTGAEPPHAVRLKTMAGASAGGMCAALTAISVLDGSTDRFRQAWVEEIDSTKLLAPNDLAQLDSLGGLLSVLNCEVLDAIADKAITLPPTVAPWPRWLGEQLDFYLTLTNLNGLTYEVTQVGGSPQRFIDHADRIQFRLLKPGAAPTPPPAPDPSLRPLRAAPRSQLTPAEAANWDELKTAALATGAFPVALLNRELAFRNEYFDHRTWWYGGQQRPDYVQRAAGPDENQEPYRTTPAPYLFVDGGVTDNNPLELVRRTLANSLDGKAQNPRGATDARRALLLIDPFPSELSEGAYRRLERSLGQVLPALYRALLNQARFRAEDLLSALDASVHSRFLIAPTRPPDARGRTTPALACGSVGAFGGFLHQPFREHDYQLGRRNCQQFLRTQFTVAETNALFSNWPAALKQRFRLAPVAGAAAELPVLPLLGTAAAEVPLPPAWEQVRLPAAKLEREIGGLLVGRVEELLRLLKGSIPRAWWLLGAGYNWFVKPKLRLLIQKSTLDFLRKDLDAAGLLEPPLSNGSNKQ